MRKIRFILSFLFVASVLSCSGQKYITATGARIGSNHLGLSLQQRVLKQTTIESIITMNSSEARLTALLEQHQKILGRRLNIYLGVGAHVGAKNKIGTLYGVDGILGLEYKMMLSRLNLSFDFQPAYHINSEDGFNIRSGITLRKVLIKDNFFKKRKRKRQRAKKKKKD